MWGFGFGVWRVAFGVWCLANNKAPQPCTPNPKAICDGKEWPEIGRRESSRLIPGHLWHDKWTALRGPLARRKAAGVKTASA